MLIMLFVIVGVKAQSDTEGMNFPPYPSERFEELSKLKNLPLRTDNSLLDYFPQIIHQIGWSCNQASSIGYMLTYELNRKRELNGEDTTTHMSPAFPYNVLVHESPTTGVSYFDTWEIIKAHGCANIVDFAYNTNRSNWLYGYDKYLRAMKNKVVRNYSISVSTVEGLNVLKSYLFNHNDNYSFGGLANIQIASTGMRLSRLPKDTHKGGSSVVLGFGTKVGHALTVVGYDDDIQYDFNNDGLYTNNLDINDDGVVTLADWEVGGLIVVNSWGKGWGDSGKAFLPYKYLTKYGNEGGIWNRSVHVIDVVHDYEPKMVVKLEIAHSQRSMLKISIGCSNDLEASYPDHIYDFPMFNYHGGTTPFGVIGSDENHMKLSLDVTSLQSFIDSNEPAKFFLMINERDVADTGSGMVYNFEIVNYTPFDTVSLANSTQTPMLNNQVTLMELINEIDFEKLKVAEYETFYTKPNKWLSIPLQGLGGAGNNYWEIVPDYNEDSVARDFPEPSGEFLPFYLGEEGFLTLDLPFDFPFYGEKFNRLFADEEGSLYLETNFIDYPYSVDKDLVFRQRKNIVPFGSNLFFSAQGNGLYYEPTDSVVRIFFDCQAHIGLQIRDYLFACYLYPDGLIEYHYSGKNLDHAERAVYRSGLSRGDGSQIFTTTQSTLGYLSPNTVVQLHPYKIPPKTKLESNSYILTRPEENNQLFEIHVRATDKNAQVAYGVIPVSTLDFESEELASSAYPNPFMNSTNISFIAREESSVEVNVYNLKGQLVKHLLSSEVEKGQHNLIWNGDSRWGAQVASGVYIARISIGDEQQQVKILKNAW